MNKFPDGSLDEFIIAGHGSSGIVRPFTTDELNKPNSDCNKFLRTLSRKLKNGGKVRIRACKVAQGKKGIDFMKKIASTADADVVSYTDTYAIVPHGDEITVRPDGSNSTTNHFNPYNGSKTQANINAIGGQGTPNFTGRK